MDTAAGHCPEFSCLLPQGCPSPAIPSLAPGQNGGREHPSLLTHRAANGGQRGQSHLMYCTDSHGAVLAWSSEAHVSLGLSCCNGLHIRDVANALGDTLPEQQLGAHLQVLWVFQEAETYHGLLPCSQLVLQQRCGHWPRTGCPVPSSTGLGSPPSGA